MIRLGVDGLGNSAHRPIVHQILDAFDFACSHRDFQVAGQLLKIIEDMFDRWRKKGQDGDERLACDIVKAHKKLWELKQAFDLAS